MADLSGQSLGRYHLLEQLGEGGMATVYKAFDTRLERDVAVKVIRRGAFPPEQLERVLKRFEREAKALAGLSHPNIVGVMDYGEYEGSPYLVMEYLPGGTLKQRLGQPMPWQEAVHILQPIASALEYAHEHGIVHRDIKPSNILLTEKGQPMLSDFGIAKLLESQGTTALTGTGVGVGTPEYMSPEQWNGQAGPGSDQYSLGVVLYEMVTGRTPYMADTPVAILLKQASEPLPSPRQFAESLPEEIERVLFKALALKPEDRYPDMAAFATALGGLAGGVRLDELRPAPAVVPASEPESQATRVQPGDAATNLQLLTPEPSPVVSGAEEKPARVPKARRERPPRPAGRHPRIGMMILAGALVVVLVAGWLLASWTGYLKPQLAYNFTRTREIDGMAMVYVPAGTFDMGSNEGSPDEAPVHPVYLDAFYIDRTEVTVGMYTLCYQAEECAAPGQTFEHSDPAYNTIAYEDYPVLNVTWGDARAYCAWAGGRLPTEAEWEKAARGTDARTYPWGNGNVNGRRLNFADASVFEVLGWDWADSSAEDGFFTTAPVGSFPAGASPYGALDMAGNAWEWVADWYAEDYYEQSPAVNPQGPASGEGRVQRGGSWADDTYHIRASFRNGGYPTDISEYVGFRCVFDVSSPESARVNPPVTSSSPAVPLSPTSTRTVEAGASSGAALRQVLFDTAHREWGVRYGEEDRSAIEAHGYQITLLALPPFEVLDNRYFTLAENETVDFTFSTSSEYPFVGVWLTNAASSIQISLTNGDVYFEDYFWRPDSGVVHPALFENRPGEWSGSIVAGENAGSYTLLIAGLSEPPITTELLEQYDLLWLHNPFNPFLPDEMLAILTYLQAGGTLLAVDQNTNNPTFSFVIPRSVTYEYTVTNADIRLYNVGQGRFAWVIPRTDNPLLVRSDVDVVLSDAEIGELLTWLETGER